MAWAICGLAACSADPVYVGTLSDQATCEPQRCFIDDETLDAQAVVDRFSGPPMGVAPRVVYPLEGAAHPPNLRELTLQWYPGSEDYTQFRVRLGTNTEAFDFYVPCLASGRGAARGCSYRLPEDLWSAAAEAFRGRSVSLQIWGRGPDAKLGAAAPMNMRFASENVEGALYYWTRSAETHFLHRWTFGSSRASAYALPPSAQGDSRCAGCHAVSRDGSTLALTVGAADPGSDVETNAAFDGRLYVAEATQPEAPSIEPTVAESDSSMTALSPDGSWVLTSFHQRLVLRDARTGEVEHEVGPEFFAPAERAFFPEFSPDGREVVVTLAVEPEETGVPLRQFAVRNGRIAVLPFNEGRFGEVPRIIVPETEELFHFYPTWSPDGHWVAFVSAPRDDERDSYSRSDARLRLVSAQGGTVYDLEAASGHTSTWPGFAPTYQCAHGKPPCDPDQRLYFLSFSSKRDYGVLLRNSALPDDEVPRSQLWLTTIDVTRLLPGLDPSAAPIWIPAQRVSASNHSGQWTERVACGSDEQCGSGERCERETSRCVPDD